MGRFDVDGLIRRLGGAQDPERFRAMLAARRAMVDQQVLADGTTKLVPRSELTAHVVQDPAALAAAGRGDDNTRRFMSLLLANEARQVQNRALRASAAMSDGSVGGLFSPTPGARPVGVVTYPQGNRAVRRHEVMHGYNEAARRGYQGLPTSSRVIGALDGSSWTRPFATVADELAAQRVGGRSFSEMNWPDYVSYYGAHGDHAAAALARALGVAGGVQRELAQHPVAWGLAAGTAATLGAALGAGEE